MTAPLPLDVAGGTTPSLVVALGVGVAFGWCLERAGLGSAPKLMGQFTLRDMTVLKVMFSAIVTAMLGLFWLSWLGVVDLSRVAVPPTFIGPQIVGGVVFGAGMALAGLCPGTSCVAAATGRLDGLTVAAGFFAGVLVTGLAVPAMADFYESGTRGAFALPAALGVTQGTVTFVVVAGALTAFALSGRVERAMAARAARVRP
ncbi:MAG: YeeE/YedE family protein [Gemmatimonadetes bacterium]|nr:YeeE/YedE family protein [Gemmatimonadota bacterium]